MKEKLGGNYKSVLIKIKNICFVKGTTTTLIRHAKTGRKYNIESPKDGTNIFNTLKIIIM